MWNSTERMVVKHGVHGPILAHQDSNLASLLNFKSQKMNTLNVHEMTSVIKSPNLTPFSANHSLSSSFQFQFEPVEKISSFLHVGLSAVSKKISSPINTISDRAHLQGAM